MSDNLTFQTYSWVVGTTSFRVKEVNYRIEKQLRLLKELFLENPTAPWDEDLQLTYYYKLQEAGLAKGNASRKSKDAREKTSVLKELGLVTDNRIITEVGNELLAITDNGIKQQNRFLIDDDAYLYLKQLLKLEFSESEFTARPFVFLLYLINKLDYLTDTEFTYFLPLVKNTEELIALEDLIIKYRSGKINLEDVFVEKMMEMENYQLAFSTFISSTDVTKELIASIGLNRKSRSYDFPYFDLYKNLINLVNKDSNKISFEDVSGLKSTLSDISSKPKSLWKKYLLGYSNRKSDQLKHLVDVINVDFSSLKVNEFRELFFKKLHSFKWQVNLEEYSDLNKRFFNLADILIFDGNKIQLRLYAKHFFKLTIEKELKHNLDESILHKNLDIEEISEAFVVTEESVAASIEIETGEPIDREHVDAYVERKEQQRFNNFIVDNFNKDNLIYLLERFENRDDRSIQNRITDNADIPTIYEYISGIAWYFISEKKFNLKKSLNMSLDANFLPKSHATGNQSDIIIQYGEDDVYKEHKLMIEVTLTTSTNQRRAEMEPVSRHLGNLKGNYPHEEVYAVFLSNFLDTNTTIDFRSRRNIPFYFSPTNSYIEDNKIIPITTSNLINILTNDISYSTLYKVFDNAYLSEVKITDWWETEINSLLS